jgi:hypothetical protein
MANQLVQRGDGQEAAKGTAGGGGLSTAEHGTVLLLQAVPFARGVYSVRLFGAFGSRQSERTDHVAEALQHKRRVGDAPRRHQQQQLQTSR